MPVCERESVCVCVRALCGRVRGHECLCMWIGVYPYQREREKGERKRESGKGKGETRCASDRDGVHAFHVPYVTASKGQK
jgi:hypothetical protein